MSLAYRNLEKVTLTSWPIKQFFSLIKKVYGCFNLNITFTFMHLADAFIQSDLQLHSGYTFFISMCVPWESNPQPFALLMQCSTTEPHRNIKVYTSLAFNMLSIYIK